MRTTLAIALDALPLTSDTHWPADYDARFVGHAMVRTLLTEGPDGGPVPAAALEVEPADGGRRWLVRLNRRLRWSDGPALTTADACRSARRVVARPRTGVSRLLGRGGPGGSGPEPVVAIDSYTVEYRFPRPLMFAPALLTLPQFAPSRAGGTHFGAPTLGDYVFAGATADSVRLRRHPRAFLDGVAGGLVFTRFGRLNDALRAFERGGVDLTPATSLGPAELARYASHPGLTARNLSIVGSLEFGHRAGELRASARLRHVVGSALDRDRIARACAGLVRPLRRHTAPWWPEPAGAGSPRQPTGAEIDAVRAHLGDPVPVSYADFMPNGIVVAQVCAQLREVFGLTAVPRPLSYLRYVRAALEEDQPLLYTLTSADYPHPAALLLPWRSDGARAERSGFADPAFDDMVDRAAACPDPGPARQLWEQADQRWWELMPRVPLLQVRAHCVHGPRVGGMHLTSAGLVPFGQLTVESAASGWQAADRMAA